MDDSGWYVYIDVGCGGQGVRGQRVSSQRGVRKGIFSEDSCCNSHKERARICEDFWQVEKNG